MSKEGNAVRRYDRRRLLGGALLLGAGSLGVASCGRSDQRGGGSAANGTRLVLGWWGNDERDRRTREAIRTYSAAHDVQVTEQVANWDNYWDKLATQIAGGNAPDVLQMDYAYITQYASQGSLLELDSHIPKPLAIEDFDQSSLKSGQVDGKTYAVSMGVNSTSLYMNSTMLRKLGIELPDDTMTWDQYAELMRRIATDAPDNVHGGPNLGRVDVAFEAWLIQRGATGRYSPDGSLGYDADDFTEWLEFWHELDSDGVLMPVEEEDALSGDVSDAPIATGTAPFAVMWSNQYAALTEATEDDIEFHVLPQGNSSDAGPGQFYKASMLISVSADTDYPDEAVEFAAALIGDPKVAGKLGFERGVPPDPKVRERLKADAAEPDLRSMEYVEAIESNLATVPPPDPAEAPELDTAFLYATDELFYGRFSVNQAVDHFFGEAEKILG